MYKWELQFFEEKNGFVDDFLNEMIKLDFKL